tara:strand:+ start:2307 stop:5222 length:2916 start_codon:yes stop_codon:yes gene_type:complete
MPIVGAIYHEYKLSVTDLVFYSATEESIVQSEGDTQDAVLIGFTIILIPNDKNLEIQRFEYGEDPERAAFNSSQNPDDISSEIDRRLAREYINDFIVVYGDSRVIGVEAVYNDRVNALRKRLNTFGMSIMTEAQGERVWYPPTTFPVINYVMPGSELQYYKSNIEDYNEDPDLLAEDYFYYPDESYKLDRYVQGEFVPNYDAVLPRPNEYLEIIRDGFKKVPLNQIREVGIPVEGSDNFIVTEEGGIRSIDPNAEVSPISNTNQTNSNENPNAISQERPTSPEPEDVVEEIINPPSQITTDNNIRETIENNPTRTIPNVESRTGKKRRRKEADSETVNRDRKQQQADENTTAATNIVKKKIKGRVIDSKTLKPIPASIVYTLEIVKELTVSGGEENELENVNQIASDQQGTFNTRIILKLTKPRIVNESGATDQEEAFAELSNSFRRFSDGVPGTAYIIDNNNRIIRTIQTDQDGNIDTTINLPISLNSQNNNFTNFRILFRSLGKQTKFQYIKYTNPNEVPTLPNINDLNLGEISLPDLNSNVQSFTRDTPSGERESTIFDFLSLPEVEQTPSGPRIIPENSELIDGAPIPLEDVAELQEIVDPDEIPNFKGADSSTFEIDTNKKGRFTIKFGTSYNSMPNTITVSKEGYMTKSVRILQKDGLKKLNLGDIPLVSNDVDFQQEVEEIKLDLSPSQVLNKIPNLNAQPLDVTKAKLRGQFFETLIKTLLPVILSLLASFGMSKISEILSGKLDKNKKCPSPEKLDEIVKRRNNLADKLNSIYVTIQAATVTLGIAQTLITTIKSLLEVAKKVPIPLGAPIGIGVPANVVTELSSGIEDKKKQVEFYSNLTTGVLLFLTLIGVVLKTIIDLLSKVDELVERCSKDKSLTPINPDLLKLTNQPQVPEQQIQEEDFTFKIETENTTSNFKRRRAIAIDKNGVTVLKGEFSYSADTKILIDELKFYIQENDLKAE